jgi:biopolymer transport protein ExbD
MSRKLHAHAEGGGVNLGLIITPFLDMAFQVLAFFIMTYHPSALEAHVPGLLLPPESGKRSPAKNEIVADPRAISVDPDELVEAIHVHVPAVIAGRIEGDRRVGDPSRILIKQQQDAKFEVVADSSLQWDECLRRLEKKLREARVGSVGGKVAVKVEADGEVRQQFVMQVYDTCKRAGIDKVHFVPPVVQVEGR